MTSACIFNDTMRNDTQVFLKNESSIFEIFLHPINFNFTSYFVTSSTLTWNAGTSKDLLLAESELVLTAILNHFSKLVVSNKKHTQFFKFSKLQAFLVFVPILQAFIFLLPKMAYNISIDSNDSDVFHVKQLSIEPSPQRKNTSIVLNSTELSGTPATGMLTISSVTSPELNIVTFESVSNEPTIPYGFGDKQPTVPPSLNDLNLQPNPFNVSATMAVILPDTIQHDEDYSPQSPDPSLRRQFQRPQ